MLILKRQPYKHCSRSTGRSLFDILFEIRREFARGRVQIINYLALFLPESSPRARDAIPRVRRL